MPDRAYYRRHATRLKAARKLYYQANRQQCLDAARKHQAENREAILLRRRARYQANKSRLQAERREYYATHRHAELAKNRRWAEKNRPSRLLYKAQQRAKRKQETPWLRHLDFIKVRCTSRSHQAYRYYGGRGIRCELSESQIKELWMRDNAATLERPSIDRINPTGNYTIENCRFIEHRENSSRARSKRVVQAEAVGR